MSEHNPYLLSDPRLLEANRTAVAYQLGHGTPPGWLLAPGTGPLPIPEPMAVRPDSPRTMELLALPFAWLPDEIWARYPHETDPGYATRVTVALDAMGLLADTGDGVWYASVEDAPSDADAAARTLAALDGDADDAGTMLVAERMRARMLKAWPGGYPAGEQIGFARRTAGLALTANLALAGMRALDMDAHGDREGATGVIRAAMRVWPGLFPDRPDRDALAAWVSDLHGRGRGAAAPQSHGARVRRGHGGVAMSRESEDRERDRFASDTDRWSPWAALIGVGSFLLIPVWRLLSWLIGLL